MTEKKVTDPLQKRKFPTRNYSIIENLNDELYQLENKPAKCAKLRAKIKWELEDKKCSK